MNEMERLLFRTRRLFAEDMLCSDGSIYFDGKKVCRSLMSEAFFFSGDNLSAILKSNERYNDTNYTTLDSFSSSTSDR